MRIVFASNNQNKFREIQGLIPHHIQLLTLDDIGFFDDIEETGNTLEENSLLKAKTIFDFCQIPTIADDTGLEVYALDMAPGVFSARYAGEQKSSEDNIDKILTQILNHENRKARFRTIFTLVDGKRTIQFEGAVEGRIATEKHGNQGFGYDPIFYPENELRTFAQMSLEEKNNFSHRARSLQKLIGYLAQEFSTID
jgi:XTP/dITP diphosphohydrolase